MREVDEDLASSFSRTRFGTNSGVAVVANEGAMATCPSRSLTHNRCAEEASIVCDSWRLALIAAILASIVVSAAPIASTQPN
jgi:hypothetical protein